MAIKKIGNEVQVNSFTTSSQQDSEITALADGGWLVTWSSWTNGFSFDIVQQRYSSAGTPIGGQARVNTVAEGEQGKSAVTSLPDGGWVVTWESGGDVYQQRYAASGAATGGELRVNTFTNNAQSAPAVTVLADGGWVVTWQSVGQGQGPISVYQQRYASTGLAVGGETEVARLSSESSPCVTALNDGGWLVTFSGQIGGPFSFNLYQQRFAADGTAIDGPAVIPGMRSNGGVVTALPDGGWIVAGLGNDGSIYQHRYTSAGAAAGGGVRVSSDAGLAPAVTALADGGWVVTWQSMIPGDPFSRYDLYQRQYTSAGVAVGAETRVNSYTLDDQISPTIKALADGSWVVTWSSYVQDGSEYGVFQQRFGSGLPEFDLFNDEGVSVSNAITNQANVVVSGITDPNAQVTVRDGTTVVGTATANGMGAFSIVTSALEQGSRTLTITSGTRPAVTALVRVDTIGFIDGTDGNDRIVGGLGNDVLVGYAGADTLLGGGGGDTLVGGGDNDSLFGGAGDDQLAGQSGGDLLDGGTGQDYARYYDYVGPQLVVDLLAPHLNTGDAAGDTFIAVEGIVGSNTQGDVLRGDYFANVIFGLGGSDIIEGRNGSDQLYGDAGADYLLGGEDPDQLFGGADGDHLYGGSAGDLLDGGEGFDYARYDLYAGAERLVADLLAPSLNAGEATGDIYVAIEGLVGSQAADTLRGDDGVNDLHGLSGDDLIYGRGGNDALHGGEGNDILIGQTGDDLLFGYVGDDVLAGEDGADAFYIFANEGRDTIQDFRSAQGDKVMISSALASDFTALMQHAVDTSGGVTFVGFNANTQITLQGVGSLSLSASDFVFI